MLEALFKKPIELFAKMSDSALARASRGCAVLVSILHTQRNDAANYICPVWVCPCIPGTATGVLSSDGKGAGSALSAAFTEPSKGAAAELLFPFCCWRRGDRRNGLFLGSTWLGKAAHLATQDEIAVVPLQQVRRTHQGQWQVLVLRSLEFR